MLEKKLLLKKSDLRENSIFPNTLRTPYNRNISAIAKEASEYTLIEIVTYLKSRNETSVSMETVSSEKHLLFEI